MRNVKLLIEYDGTDFVGWQVQPNGRSVQGVLETTLQQILGEKVNVIGAGRTDAGVHARGQVANFHTSRSLDPNSLRGALNSLLPEDIIAHAVDDVGPDFHARYDAKERTYRYYISTVRTALERRITWYVKYTLDLQSMNDAGRRIVGEREFETFCKADRERNHTRVTVMSARWLGSGTRLTFEIRANRFLRGMVRALVGTMVDVGRGYLTVNDFIKALEKTGRNGGGMSAPAKGLFLEEVKY
ncbi:MAG: tRNA pseudouridine(38-40) synthase TruA [Bacteroidota bacterium]